MNNINNIDRFLNQLDYKYENLRQDHTLIVLNGVNISFGSKQILKNSDITERLNYDQTPVNYLMAKFPNYSIGAVRQFVLSGSFTKS